MYFRPPYKGGDVEAGAARPLYPMMMESPELRWAFIRKIYSILTFQMLLTIAVAAVVVYVHPIHNFFATTSAGLGLYIFLIIVPFIGQSLQSKHSSLRFCLLMFWYLI